MIRELKIASSKYENDQRSSSGKRPPIGGQDSSGAFNEGYRYDTSDVEFGMQQMKIRDDDARYDSRKSPSRTAAMSRQNLEYSKPRHLPDDDLPSNWQPFDKSTKSQKTSPCVLNCKVRISRNEQYRPVNVFLDMPVDITCISEEFIESLPGTPRAQRQPPHIRRYTINGETLDIVGRSTIQIAWIGAEFRELVVNICRYLPDAELLLSRDFV